VTIADQIKAVFSHWKVHHPRAFPKVHGELREWKKVRDRLKDGYSIAQLCRAIDGIHVRPFNCGENDNGTKYQSLELCLRDAKHVELYLEAMDDHERKAPVLSEGTQRSLRAVEAWANRTTGIEQQPVGHIEQ
jgi:hypothetical protein